MLGAAAQETYPKRAGHMTFKRRTYVPAPSSPLTPLLKPPNYGTNLHRVVEVPAPAPKRSSKPRATPLEREHMARVKRLRCVLCRRLGQEQTTITDVHHLREEQGGAQRASNWLVAALCHGGCHQGPHGIHGDRGRLRQAKATEIDLLAWTLCALAEVDATGIKPI
jgi:hypothetical protein